MRVLSKQVRKAIEDAQFNVMFTGSIVLDGHAGVIAKKYPFKNLPPVIEQYNQQVAIFNEVLAYARDDIDAYIVNRSERWQESERGERYQEWKEQLDSAAIEPVEVPASRAELDNHPPEVVSEDMDFASIPLSLADV